MNGEPQFLLIDKNAIREILTLSLVLETTEAALRKTSNGMARQQIRRTLDLPGAAGSCLSLMYAALDDRPLFGAKVLSVFPDNFTHGLASHRGGVFLFDKEHGRPVALIDGGELTAWRTAAASAVATRVLSRPESSKLTVLGYGEQARRHIAAIAEVRPICAIHVWGRDFVKAERFAEDLAASGFRAQAHRHAGEPVREADIICTTTSSQTPVLFGQWLQLGVHINAVGASVASCRELDLECVRRSRIWVDYLPMALAAAGELVEAIESGVIGVEHIRGEVGEVLAGAKPGRADDGDITLFRSLGVPAQDIELANLIYTRALDAGLGTSIDFRL
ncbi:ornithine cyclodeaminase family protein [Mesorhizobium sp. XAP10]|uniref:ornithine cyclodeaminase family protein n=1 Tax=unclassified Mesorhizobium TaxID=325217 RepID=UPI0023DF867C|nr:MULTISPECIES: ornithine cyclodeaminase family protein [unclassified Mesorhizobium]MDF3154645.1 ornithine cyclodeaminase family protein [Mesorhizobium sp. XAP10]MDF3247805.1 ornithine cyclodeaminase family protein [Mesorhizobium sp. XAP4]